MFSIICVLLLLLLFLGERYHSSSSLRLYRVWSWSSWLRGHKVFEQTNRELREKALFYRIPLGRADVNRRHILRDDLVVDRRPRASLKGNFTAYYSLCAVSQGTAKPVQANGMS